MSAEPQESATFEATFFRADQRSPGRLRVVDGGLRFDAVDGHALLLPFDGLQLRISGIHHENLHFSHPTQPGGELVTQAPDLLRDPRPSRHPQIAPQLAQATRRQRRGKMILPGCILAILLPILLLWLLKEPIVDAVAGWIPVSWESEIGDLLFTGLEAQIEILDDPDLDRRLDELVAPLLAAVPDPGYAFDFHLAEDPSLNAFALPGGHIVVHSGLVTAAEAPEDLLGILGHEIAHVTERHSLRQMIRSAGLLAVFQFLFGDVTGVAAVVADGGYRLIALQHSRTAELEADEVGFDLLLDAGIDPRGLIRFFDRLQQELADSPAAEFDGSLNLLSTHPMSSERQQRLEERWQEVETGIRLRAPSFDLEAFKEAVSAAVDHTAE